MRLLPVLALLGLLAGCAEPTNGSLLPAKRSALPDPEVRVVTAVDGETEPGGGVQVDSPGQTAVVTGWLPAADARLLLVAPGPRDVVSVRRLVREDLPAGEGAGPDVGFQLLVRDPGAVVEEVCLVAELPDRRVELAGSQCS